MLLSALGIQTTDSKRFRFIDLPVDVHDIIHFRQVLSQESGRD